MPAIDRVTVNVDQIAAFKNEDEFTGLAVDLMVETGQYVEFATRTMGPKAVWTRDQAAVGGNMVRLYKLIHSVLDQTVQRRQETSYILLRLLFETLVNIRYLIANFSPDLVQSYVEYSLRQERKLNDTINANIEARGGIVLPIEDRMLKSIGRAAKAAQVDLDAVDPQKKAPWGGKNLFDKAQAIGWESMYLPGAGLASHSIHGNWEELYGNHLDWDEKTGGFSPNLDWHVPRPQMLYGICRLTIEATESFLRLA